jgi:aspartate carbamoyltransferase catalytic subunit
MKELSVNHLLGIKYITKNDIDLIFETADHFKEVINRPIKKSSFVKRYYYCQYFF